MNIILYVIDALRADHLSCYGYPRPITPNLDLLASEGIAFTNCFSPATWTRPVAASILTGVYPRVHGALTFKDTLAGRTPTLATILGASGYKTGAFSAMGQTSTVVESGGGFDEHRALYRSEELRRCRRNAQFIGPRLQNWDVGSLGLPSAEDVYNAFLEWYDPKDEKPFFSFMWMIDTHWPYDPAPGFIKYGKPLSLDEQKHFLRTRSRQQEKIQALIDLADNETHYVDFCLGELVRHLKATHQYDNSLVIVASDHGDAFLDHGTTGHSHIPYDELLHVPLVIKMPQGKYAGTRVDSLVWLGDIMPTILDLLGSAMPQIQGKSLLPLVRGEATEIHDYVFSDSALPGGYWLSARSHEWKYIVAEREKKSDETFRYQHEIAALFREGRLRRVLRYPLFYLRRYVMESKGYDPVQVFDLLEDPGEMKNLASKRPEITSRLSHILEDWRQDCDRLAVAHLDQENTFDLEDEQELKEHLRALGYVE